jgi:hypothetical protein
MRALTFHRPQQPKLQMNGLHFQAPPARLLFALLHPTPLLFTRRRFLPQSLLSEVEGKIHLGAELALEVVVAAAADLPARLILSLPSSRASPCKWRALALMLLRSLYRRASLRKVIPAFFCLLRNPPQFAVVPCALQLCLVSFLSPISSFCSLLQVEEEMLAAAAPAPPNPHPEPTLPLAPAHLAAGMKAMPLQLPLLSRPLVEMLLLPRGPLERAVGAECDCCRSLKLLFAALPQFASVRVHAPPLLCFLLPLPIPFLSTEYTLPSFSSALRFAFCPVPPLCVNYCALVDKLLRRAVAAPRSTTPEYSPQINRSRQVSRTRVCCLAGTEANKSCVALHTG